MAGKRGVGRPTKLATHGKAIIALLRKGLGRNAAAKAAGVGTRTASRWAHEGSRDDAPPEQKEFFKAWEQAEALAQADILNSLTKMAKGYKVRVRKRVQVVDPETGLPKVGSDGKPVFKEEIVEKNQMNVAAALFLAKRSRADDPSLDHDDEDVLKRSMTRWQNYLEVATAHGNLTAMEKAISKIGELETQQQVAQANDQSLTVEIPAPHSLADIAKIAGPAPSIPGGSDE